MASGWDEVQKSVDSVVPEASVALDARLFGQNVIVLALEVPDNLLKACIGGQRGA